MNKRVKVEWKGESVGRKASPDGKKKAKKKKKRLPDENIIGFFNAPVAEKAS